MKRLIFVVILLVVFATYAIQTIGQTSISAGGVIESKSGGFKFPDGSVQTSATLPPCTAITYLPYVISEAGVYCFTGNLSTSISSGNAITVATDNVVIDLNGWVLDGLVAGASTSAKGIHADQLTNITIRNGTIRGFSRGVHLEDVTPFSTSRGHVIEDIRADSNTLVGFLVMGSNNILRRNQIVNTGGGSVISTIDIGIWFYGPGGRLIDNDINDTDSDYFANGSGYGLQVEYADGAVIESNRIDAVFGSGTGSGRGIVVQSSNDLLVIGNRITRSDYGIYFHNCTECKYMNNFTSGVTTPFTGGIDAGGND